MRTSIALAFAVLAPAGLARAGSESSGLGVGVESTLTGVAGPSVAYQAPKFHLEGILGFHDDGTTEIDAAGRFYFHVHSTR